MKGSQTGLSSMNLTATAEGGNNLGQKKGSSYALPPQEVIQENPNDEQESIATE